MNEHIRSGIQPAFIAAAILCALTGCHSRPVAEAPTIAGTSVPEPDSSATAEPAASEEAPDAAEGAQSHDSSGETEAALPPCLPSTPKPKPKRKPKPRPVQPEPTAPLSDSGPPAPSNGVINAEVEPLRRPVISILGKKVESPEGEDMGRVVDVLADDSGKVRIAIVEFGGFLGVGNRRIAVEWPLLRFHPNDKEKPLILNVTRKKLQEAPDYKDAINPQALMAPETPAPPAAAPASPATTDGKK